MNNSKIIPIASASIVFVLSISYYILATGDSNALSPTATMNEQQQELFEFRKKLESSLENKKLILADMKTDLLSVRAEIKDLEVALSVPQDIAGVYQLTAEEIAESFKRAGKEARLEELKQIETALVNEQIELEKEINELLILLAD